MTRLSIYGRVLLAFLLLVSCAGNALAAPAVYPLHEVIGFTDKGMKGKAPVFGSWVEGVGVPSLSVGFVEAVRKEFGTLAVDGIDGATKHRILVASLHLVRASQYTVPKKLSGCTEYHLPITLSLVFTNPSTGNVIYSFTDTSYASVELGESDAPERSAALLTKATADNYAKLLASLVRKAKQGYNPAEVEAFVAKVWKGLYILNKGSKFGIASGDSLIDAAGNEIEVRYAAEDYAIAAPLLVSTVSKGQVFSKFSDQSLVKTVKKPKVLSMQDGWKDDQLKKIAALFDSELSKESAFTLLPVNEGFTALLSSLGRETSIGQSRVTNQRALPDYLIKFNYSAPRVYQITREGKFGLQVYEQYVLGELLDKQGRIIYSAVAGDRIEDKDVGGMVFSKEARLEILLKNAVKKLAEQFSHSIKFSCFEVPVTRVDGTKIELQDEAHQLRPGTSVQVFRNIGKVDGVPGSVLMPIWTAEVGEANGKSVRATLVLPVSDEVAKLEVSRDDLVIVNAISAGAEAGIGSGVSYCGGDLSPNLGAIKVDDFSVLGHAFGYLLPYPLYDNDPSFFGKVSEAVQYGGFSSSSLKLGQVDTAGRCLLPLYKASLEKTACEDGDCEASLALAAGYRLYIGTEKKGGGASETKVSLNEVRESALSPVIQGEASSNAVRLLKESISKVRYK